MTSIEHDVPLARLTTIGVGGPARAFARPRSVAELGDALRYARDEGLDVLAVGLGSNLLAADEDVDALVLRLEGELAAVELIGDRSRCGGRCHERGVPAPGTRRRARRARVRMRHPRARREEASP